MARHQERRIQHLLHNIGELRPVKATLDFARRRGRHEYMHGFDVTRMNPELRTALDANVIALGNAISMGSTAGIEVNIRNMTTTLARSHRANGLPENLTEREKVATKRVLRQALKSNAAAGLQNINVQAALEVSSGNSIIITDNGYYGGVSRISTIFDLAADNGVVIQTAVQGLNDETLRHIPLTRERAIADFYEAVDEKLPDGLFKLVDGLGNAVANMFLSHRPTHDAKIAEWLKIMSKRGFNVSNNPDEQPSTDIRTTVRTERKINVADIDRLKEEVVRENLVSGIAHIPLAVKGSVSYPNGNFYNPGDGEVELYIEEARRLGNLIDDSLTTLTGEGKFNPKLIEPTIIEAIRANLDLGLEFIVKNYGRSAMEGDVSQAAYMETTARNLAEYARKHGIQVDEQALEQRMIQGLTTDAIRTAIAAKLLTIQSYVRKGDQWSADYEVNNANRLRDLAAQKGMDVAREFASVDHYLQSVGIS